MLPACLQCCRFSRQSGSNTLPSLFLSIYDKWIVLTGAAWTDKNFRWRKVTFAKDILTSACRLMYWLSGTWREQSHSLSPHEVKIDNIRPNNGKKNGCVGILDGILEFVTWNRIRNAADPSGTCGCVFRGSGLTEPTQNTTLRLVLGRNWVIFYGESVFWLLCLPTGQVAEVTTN